MKIIRSLSNSRLIIILPVCPKGSVLNSKHTNLQLTLILFFCKRIGDPTVFIYIFKINCGIKNRFRHFSIINIQHEICPPAFIIYEFLHISIKNSQVMLKISILFLFIDCSDSKCILFTMQNPIPIKNLVFFFGQQNFLHKIYVCSYISRHIFLFHIFFNHTFMLLTFPVIGNSNQQQIIHIRFQRSGIMLFFNLPDSPLYGMIPL